MVHCYTGGKFMAARLVQAFPALHNCKFIFILSSPSLDPTAIQLNAIKMSTFTSVPYQLYVQLSLQALQSCVLIKVFCVSLMLGVYVTEMFHVSKISNVNVQLTLCMLPAHLSFQRSEI